MNEQKRLKQFFQRHPHHHQTFFSRPYVSRRQFFELIGAGVTGSFLLPRLGKAQQSPVTTNSGATTQNTAKNVIFILLTGAKTAAPVDDRRAAGADELVLLAAAPVELPEHATSVAPLRRPRMQDEGAWQFLGLKSVSTHGTCHGLRCGCGCSRRPSSCGSQRLRWSATPSGPVEVGRGGSAIPCAGKGESRPRSSRELDLATSAARAAAVQSRPDRDEAAGPHHGFLSDSTSVLERRSPLRERRSSRARGV